MLRPFIALLALSFLIPGAKAQDRKELVLTHETTTKSAGSRYIGLDMVELVGGSGDHTNHGRLALHWKVKDYRLFKNDLTLTLAGSYAIYDLQAKNGERGRQLRDMGLTPTAFHGFRKNSRGFRPFVEMGIGFHYLTHKEVSEKDLSTHFQFGDHFSIGFEFGKRLDYRINYQFQHLSNGGIESPNPGINFHLISFGARLR